MSGSVFLFDEDESGIKRWTDGVFWSPSRILGNFLIYREVEKKSGGAAAVAAAAGSKRRKKGEDADDERDGKAERETLSRPREEGEVTLRPDKQRERVLLGSLTNSAKFKADGLMKKVSDVSQLDLCAVAQSSQTFSLSINGITQHLISYYRISDVEAGK